MEGGRTKLKAEFLKRESQRNQRLLTHTIEETGPLDRDWSHTWPSSTLSQLENPAFLKQWLTEEPSCVHLWRATPGLCQPHCPETLRPPCSSNTSTFFNHLILELSSSTCRLLPRLTASSIPYDPISNHISI